MTDAVARDKKQLTISEAGDVLGMPVKEVERLVAEGKLAHELIDGVIIIDPDSIEDFKKAYFRPPGASL